MSHFIKDDKLSKLIHTNHFLLPVINRFGIRLGFGDKTVEQVCSELNIDVNFFLTITNAYSSKDYFPEKELLSFSLSLLVDYLRKTHKYYFDYLLPELERRLELLLDKCNGTCSDLALIKSFYNTYKKELKKHIDLEEEAVFPYINALVESSENNSEIDKSYKDYSILNYEKEHTNIDQKLYDLKNIIIKYLEPTYNDNDCNSFLFALFQLEQDILDHASIEDKVLVVKVLELEKEVQHG